MQISKLLDQVESNAIVLPEFQREFVWKDSQAKELMDSLVREYPIGGLLVWSTESPPEIKNDAIDEEKQALFQVLLDGQQRLTVLYMLLKDDYPPYYTPEEIKNDPRNLYFNVRNGEFHFENKMVREGSEWVKVVDVFSGDVTPISIAKENKQDADDFEELAELYEEQLGKLRKIETLDIPLEALPKSANVHQAIELFDKINSQGTHLSDAELALAHMSAQWPHIRRHMKAKQNQLADRGFNFNLNFYVKTMIGTITETMTYENVYDIRRDRLEREWEMLAEEDGIFDYVVNVLENDAHIPSSEYINTRDVLIPFIVFLRQRDKQISHEEKVGFLRWIYAAMMWSRYSGSADSRVEHDIALLDSENPTELLMQEIRDDRGRIEVEPSDLAGRGKRTRRFYNMLHIVTRANDPVDWKTGAPLKGTYSLESHHIFPKSELYDERFDGNNSEHRKLVNEIANRAFLTPETNRNIIRDRPPSEYLPEVADDYPKALQSQFIPMEKELWSTENYEEFLANRRQNIADAINDYMDDLQIGTRDGEEESVEDLIERGENARIEFKETFLYDVHQDQANKDLKKTVVKEIASLANAEGGVVIIGVEDESKEATGIDRDLKLMQKGKDDFKLQLTREISERLGHMMGSVYTEVEFEIVDDEEICVIWVDPSPDPVYFEGGGQDQFYVRAGSSADPLTMQEAQQYIERHFA